ncbi:podocalyxin [Mugil cephalus]|uniref:podocalyxin n=1 Tax=Mugil cephalus TaxID=48193 RepID=UPI001FB5AD82|nr:podocalyxin [Mugil cephalus]
MRAITWLLLTLSFLLHSVSVVTAQENTTTTTQSSATSNVTITNVTAGTQASTGTSTTVPPTSHSQDTIPTTRKDTAQTTISPSSKAGGINSQHPTTSPLATSVKGTTTSATTVSTTGPVNDSAKIDPIVGGKTNTSGESLTSITPSPKSETPSTPAVTATITVIPSTTISPTTTATIPTAATTNSPAASGSASSGPATNGPTTNGPVAIGPTADGPTTKGTAAKGTAAKGTAANDPATNSPTTNRPATNSRAATTANGNTNGSTTTSPSTPRQKTFFEKDEKDDMAKLCKKLASGLETFNCTMTFTVINNKTQFHKVVINGTVKNGTATKIYDEILESQKSPDNKTLIAILASCGALLIMIVILAVCATHHRKPYNENQQHLTEELHTVENGYHDNPTLEVMEVQPEMQEKKMALNGEFNDSWIVPIDNLLKEDIPDEEDTHL